MQKCLELMARALLISAVSPETIPHSSKAALHKRMVVRMFQKHKDQEDELLSSFENI